MESTIEIQHHKRTVRQQEIVNAARRIIIADGIKNLTVRGIAADLDITDGALYRHFKSKKKILSLLIEDIEETLLGAIKNAANQESDPLQKLENIFFAHLSYAEQRKGVSFILINESLNLHDKTLRREMFGVVEKYLNTIESILTQGVRLGIFRKDLAVDATGFIFWGMIQSTITHWSLSGYNFTLKKSWLMDMFSVFKKGIMTR